MDPIVGNKVKQNLARLRGLAQVSVKCTCSYLFLAWQPEREWVAEFDDVVALLKDHVKQIANQGEKSLSKQDLLDIANDLDDLSFKVGDDVLGV
jgi:hypothetical protein